MKGLPMRRQSIFASSKQILQASADLTADTVNYARQEINASARASRLENTADLSADKLAVLKELFSELTQLKAQEPSELVDMQIEIVELSIAEIKSI
jgi:hypothetical protein